ncbi:MAG: phosphatase PAP2 family protein, partial [Actinomycetota bacterium]|nr:phosphatase PAP2 family protein [Actinomycetota bacterium]
AEADARFGARALLAAAAVALVGIPFGLLLLLVRSRWRPLLALDAGARDALHGYAVDHDTFVTGMTVVSGIGSWPVYVAVFAAVVTWLLWRRLPRLAVFVVVTVLGGWALNATMKQVVHRARPVLLDPVAQARGLSFPSGHAQSAMVAYGVLLLVFLPVLARVWRRLAVAAAVLMVLAIGFSRVALGVHYVTDVLAGYVLGAAWVAAMISVFNVWRVERGERLYPAHRK